MIRAVHVATRLVLAVACLLIAITGLFPPIEAVASSYEGGRIRVFPVGRAFIFLDNPLGSSEAANDDERMATRIAGAFRRIAVQRLLLEWAGIAAAAASVILLLGALSKVRAATAAEH